MNEQLTKHRTNRNSEDKTRLNNELLRNGKMTESSINKSVQFEKYEKSESKMQEIIMRENSNSYQLQTKQTLYRQMYPQLKDLYNNFRSIITDLDHDYLRQFSKYTKYKNLENMERMIKTIIKVDQSDIKNQIDTYANNFPKKLLQKKKLLQYSQEKIDLNYIRSRKKSEQYIKNNKDKDVLHNYSKRLEPNENIRQEIQTVHSGYANQKQKQYSKIIKYKHLEFNFENFKVFRNRINQEQKYSELKFIDFKNKQQRLKKNPLHKSQNVKKQKMVLSPRNKQIESIKKYMKIQRYKNQSFQSQAFESKESLIITPNNVKKLQFLLPKISSHY